MGLLSIASIAALLAAPEAAPELIESLSADPRDAVARLLAKRARRLQAEAREEQRLAALHLHETELLSQGHRFIAGVDEAGRGPLAGPVVVAAVILPPGCRLPGLDDSKKLSPQQRENLYTAVTSAALAVRHVVIDHARIDRLNIYQATLEGMYQALAALRPLPDAALIDAMPLRRLTIPCRSLIHGDSLSASIAAASVIAKVERDRIMEDLDKTYPDYGFARHKGYATPEHLGALNQYGPCPIHRKSFAPVKTWGALFSEDQ
ncbi:MAG: ribonuclease HII [Negativicutes bacterium]|nr:ribonuclease HII [Negativicutes bacterium]